jgi:hypothetical protein
VPAREDRSPLQCRRTSKTKEGGIAYFRARQRWGKQLLATASDRPLQAVHGARIHAWKRSLAGEGCGKEVRRLKYCSRSACDAEIALTEVLKHTAEN